MPRNFGQEFLDQILKFEDKTCLIWRETEITFRQFHEKIELWRTILEYQKKQSSNPLRIALFCTNSPDILALIVAGQLVGVTIIPLNPSYKKYEIEKYFLESRANFVIVSDDVDLEKFEDMELQTVSEVVSSAVDANQNEEHSISTSGVLVFFSSGTTGPPKLYEYTQRNLCAQIDQINEIRKDSRFFSPSQSDVCYGVLPFFHAGGVITVLSMIYNGCSLLINERWNEEEFLTNCQNYKVSVLFLVPPVLNFLANHPLVPKFDLSSLKTIYVGSAPSKAEDFEKVSKRLPALENLIQIYGTTECGVFLCSTGKGITLGRTIGLPLPLIKIKINKGGELIIKSPTGVEEDFMETGDLGAIHRKTNELAIVGRKKEMIKVRGWQVNPNEIEDVIRKVNGVTDCAVYQSAIGGKLIAKVIGKTDIKLDIMIAVQGK
ncbi:hypothetical protein CAEBREN_08854 [Caenorhabditis brenneri]|uniref:AMP-dependent synthetase/ligase domain-containing protein n=1 Tax=Caenorhabditis brenneri TaxID=135651 RepID=G0NJH6_CAEBE|nr:hypothetical protein CAEBREN_08854 [Caenorhabditis brenneri]